MLEEDWRDCNQQSDCESQQQVISVRSWHSFLTSCLFPFGIGNQVRLCLRLNMTDEEININLVSPCGEITFLLPASSGVSNSLQQNRSKCCQFNEGREAPGGCQLQDGCLRISMFSARRPNVSQTSLMDGQTPGFYQRDLKNVLGAKVTFPKKIRGWGPINSNKDGFGPNPDFETLRVRVSKSGFQVRLGFQNWILRSGLSFEL